MFKRRFFRKTTVRLLTVILIIGIFFWSNFFVSQLEKDDVGIRISQPVSVDMASPEKKPKYEISIGESGSPVWIQQLLNQSSLPPILGNRPATKRFLAIGMSSVYRKENYLKTALNSLLFETYPDEREKAVVIINLADTELEKRKKQMDLIQTKFRPYLDSGFIQVISSTPDIYPSMNFVLTKRMTVNEPVCQALWRTKQVVDVAFLFSYIKSQAEYYIFIDDDVIFAPQFITAVKDYIDSKQSTQWLALHFTQFVGIGLLFHARELPKISQFLLKFHQDEPYDMLLRKYIHIETGGPGVMRRMPSLFQHLGVQSTLPARVTKVIDPTFNIAERRYRNRNPQIKNVSSSMQIFKEYSPRYAYAGTPGFFCGIPRKPIETFEIVFQRPTVISRLVILSGLIIKSTAADLYEENSLKTLKHLIIGGNSTGAVKCLIGEATVEASPSSSDSPDVCDNYRVIGNFSNGEFDETLNPALADIKCLLVKIEVRPEKKCIIIREIEVFQ